jgi:hypothetical protein
MAKRGRKKKAPVKVKTLVKSIEPRGRKFSVNLALNDTMKLRNPPIEGCWSTFTHPDGSMDVKWLPKEPNEEAVF